MFLRMLRRSLDAVLVSMKRRSESMSESARRFSMVHVLLFIRAVSFFKQKISSPLGCVIHAIISNVNIRLSLVGEHNDW